MTASGSMATPWHALDAEAVRNQIETTADGLAEAEATRRLSKFGPNRLVLPPTASIATLSADARM